MYREHLWISHRTLVAVHFYNDLNPPPSIFYYLFWAKGFDQKLDLSIWLKIVEDYGAMNIHALLPLQVMYFLFSSQVLPLLKCVASWQIRCPLIVDCDLWVRKRNATGTQILSNFVEAWTISRSPAASDKSTVWYTCNEMELMGGWCPRWSLVWFSGHLWASIQFVFQFESSRSKSRAGGRNQSEVEITRIDQVERYYADRRNW